MASRWRCRPGSCCTARVPADVEAVDRVHIIGGMGAGKTFLARRLGAVLSAPVHEMDLGRDHDAVLAQPRWIAEGIFLWSIEEILDAADVVVWLDLPYRTCVRRIVIRHAVASARRTNRHKGLRKLWKFAWSSRGYWRTAAPRPPTGPTDWAALSRAQTVLTIEPYRSKVVHLRSQRSVDAWLDGFVQTRAAQDGADLGEIPPTSR